MKIKIGIITVTYNSQDVMADFLASVFAQTHIDFKLYVYDNNSDSPIDCYFKDYPRDKIKYVSLSENYGFARSNNYAIQKALADNCEFILLINNDTIFDSELLSCLLAVQQQQQAKIVAPKMLYYPDTSVIWWAGGFFDKAQAQKNIHVGMGEVDNGQFNTSCWVDFAPMCCTLIHKDVFKEIGCLDENYFIYYEDADWMYRAKLAGIQVWYAADVKLYHKVSSLTGGPKSWFTVYHSTRSKIYFINKFYRGCARYQWLLRYFGGLFVGVAIGRYTRAEFKTKLRAFFTHKMRK